MNPNPWTPRITTRELDERLENAFRRAMGSVRYDLDLEHARLNTMKDTAAGALEQGLNQVGPLFAKVGQGLASVGSFRPGPAISLKDMAGDILREFYTEGMAAFAVQLTALQSEGMTWLKEQGKDESTARATLEAAAAGCAMPDKEQFTREALPMVQGGLSLIGNLVLGALAGLALGIALTRSPHLGIGLALIGGGLGWYQGRQRMRARAQRLVLHLPRTLYQLMLSQWNANIRRFADAVNAGR